VTRALSVVCGALALVVCRPTALAAGRRARAPNRRVELVMARPVEETAQFEAALREVLASKGLRLTSARRDTITAEDVALATTAAPDESASIVARVFVDFTAPGHATLFLIDPRRGRIHVRRVKLEHGFDPVARESALFVIEQSIDAILEGREIGVSRQEYQRSVAAPAPARAPAPAPAPAPAVPSPPPAPAPPAAGEGMRLLLAGGYDGVAMGSGAYQHGARLLVAVRFARVQIGVAADVAAPVSIAGAGARARLSTLGPSVSGQARLWSLRRLSFFGGLAGALEWTRVEATVTGPDLQAAPAFWAGSPSLRAFVGIERLFGRMSVTVALGAEAHPLAERYTVRTNGEARDVYVPRRLRPAAALLFGVLF